MFEVGDKVVCIDADFAYGRQIDSMVGHLNTYPVEKGIYTVRELTNEIGMCSGIRLEEIINPKYKHFGAGMQEASFKSTRFVKLFDLIEMEDALEEAKQILQLTPEPV